MPKGYWVGLVDVSDPEGYKAYIAENAKAFRKYGARFVARGGISIAAVETPMAREDERSKDHRRESRLRAWRGLARSG